MDRGKNDTTLTYWAAPVQQDTASDHCFYFLVYGNRNEPLFDVPVAAVALVLGMVLNSLVLGILLLRRCSEERLAFLETLLGWVAFLDLVASCLVLTFDLMDHDFTQQTFKTGLFLWIGSSGAVACVIMATDRLLRCLLPLHHEAVNRNCLMRTVIVSSLLGSGCLFPILGAHVTAQLDLLLAFCVTCLVCLVWSGCALAFVVTVSWCLRQRRQREALRLTTVSGSSPQRRTSAQMPSASSSASADTYRQPAGCNAGLDVLCVLCCWCPFLIHWLQGYRQADAQALASSVPHHVLCTVDPIYLRLIVVPFLIRPLIFLCCCNELRVLWYWCRRHSRRDSSNPDSYWEAALVGSPVHSRSLVNESESMLFAYRRTSGSAKRSVCFQNVDERTRGSFLPEFLTATKRPQNRKRAGRYWKRYSCSSCSEPMSLFTSSSTTSINHIHIGAVPLPNGNYKREIIARRSSAFRGSSNITNTAGGIAVVGGGSGVAAAGAYEAASFSRHGHVCPHVMAAKAAAEISFEAQTRRSSL